LKKINYVNMPACDDCSIRSRRMVEAFRAVSRLENEAVLDRMAPRLVDKIRQISGRIFPLAFGFVGRFTRPKGFFCRDWTAGLSGRRKSVPNVHTL
jgi:hypothetical protein